MKSYNEMANDVFRRIGEYETEQKKKRKAVIRSVTSVGCVCILALLCVGVWQSGLFKRSSDVIGNGDTAFEQTEDNNQNTNAVTKPDTDITGSTNTPVYAGENADTYESGESHEVCVSAETGVPGREWTLNVNRIIETVSRAKRYYDPALYYEEVWDRAKMAEYLGVDISALGNGLTYSGGDGVFTVTFANDGTTVYDTAVYPFNGSDIEIIVSKIGLPYDCIYKLESKNKSEIKTESGSTVSALIGASEDGLFCADFECGGLNYRITAVNTSETVFAEIVKAVAELSEK